MTEKDEKRLEEIREEELKLYYEKDKIYRAEEYKQEKLLYAKVNKIKKKTKVNFDDIKYLLKCASKVSFNYIDSVISYYCENIEMSLGVDYILLTQTLEGESYEGAWGDVEQDLISNFEYLYKVDKDIPCEFVSKKESSNYVPCMYLELKDTENDTITIIMFLDETKLGRV